MADERAAMDDESFGRERLGIWDTASAHRVISEAAWSRCADPNLPRTTGEICIAADVSPNREVATIAAAGFTPAGIPFVDAGETRRGEPEWVVHRIVEVCQKNTVRAVVIDQMSAASSLIDPLRREDVTVTTTSSRQMAAACALLYDSVMAGAAGAPGPAAAEHRAVGGPPQGDRRRRLGLVAQEQRQRHHTDLCGDVGVVGADVGRGGGATAEAIREGDVRVTNSVRRKSARVP